MLPRVLVSLSLVGCGHDPGDPASTPISAITFDAVFVVNGEDASISVIDAQRDEVAATIELENVDYPHHIYLSPDRSAMVLAAPGSDLSGGHGGGGGHGGAGGAVLILDARTGAMKAFRRLDAPNHNAVFAPSGRLWTSQMASPGQVLVLDPDTLTTRASVTAGDTPAEVTFSSSGSHAFVANTASNTVSVFDPASAEVIQTITVGDGPVGAWPGADGQMYVDNETGKSLSVIDPTTLVVVKTIDLGFTPAVAAISPTGDLWVTDTENGKLVFLRPSDGSKLGEITTGGGAHAIAFTPVLGKAYVTNQTDGTVSVIDVAARTVTKTLAVGAKPNGILFRAN